MKPINANSLRNALAPRPAGTHPDADLLNGFAEGSLPANERRRVVDHLAACDTCRAAVALASDAAPAPETKVGRARGMGIMFRIAIPALTATAAVAVTFLVVHRAPPRTQSNQTAAVQATPSPASQLSVSGAEPRVQPAAKPLRHEPAEPGPRARTAVPLNPAAPSQQATIAAAPAPAPQAVPLPPAAQQRVDVQSELSAGRSVSGPAPVQQSSQKMQGIAAGEPTSAFANTVTTEALAKAAATPLARPHWRINRMGQPERAFGGGGWQTVLPSDAAPMRVIATDGTNVWIGGDNAELYHSSDNGQTWSRIALPEKNGAPHSLAHLQIDSATDITIRASDGTTWTTSNGGASWK